MNHGIATSLPCTLPFATIDGKYVFSTPFVYGFRSRKCEPRMPGHTTSTWNTSILSDCEPSTCWYSANRSLASFGVDTTSTVCPAFLAQASAALLHSSSSWPTAPHEIFSVAACAAAVAINEKPAAASARIRRLCIMSCLHRWFGPDRIRLLERHYSGRRPDQDVECER